MKKSVKTILIVILVLAAIIAGLVVSRKALAAKKVDKTEYTASKETYENVIEISGTVAAAQEQKLQALSAGTVIGVFVKAGDKVQKGDVIIQLDDSEQIFNLEKQDYNMAARMVSGSARELKLMETERQALLQKVQDRRVVATFDGLIADLDVAVGDSLEAKDSIGTLVNVDYLTAQVEVAETDVSKLKIGQEVEFSFPALKDAKVTGYVTGWPAIGEITSRGATIVKAKIRIDDYPEAILPNYSFTGKIQISPTEEYIVVERYAIGYENKEPFVVIAKTGEKRNVKVIPYGRDYVKVLEGLEGGEILTQQSTPRASGQFRSKGQNKNSKKAPGPGNGGPRKTGGPK